MDKSCKNFLIYSIRYVTVKNLSCRRINRLNSLYLIINKINGHTEESNKPEHLTLVPTDESKGTLKMYE